MYSQQRVNEYCRPKGLYHPAGTGGSVSRQQQGGGLFSGTHPHVPSQLCLHIPYLSLFMHSGNSCSLSLSSFPNVTSSCQLHGPLNLHLLWVVADRGSDGRCQLPEPLILTLT